MNKNDLVRELEKIADVLHDVADYRMKVEESNAILHQSDKVLYTPLTTKLNWSWNVCRSLIAKLEVEDDE